MSGKGSCSVSEGAGMDETNCNANDNVSVMTPTCSIVSSLPSHAILNTGFHRSIVSTRFLTVGDEMDEPQCSANDDDNVCSDPDLFSCELTASSFNCKNWLSVTQLLALVM